MRTAPLSQRGDDHLLLCALKRINYKNNLYIMPAIPLGPFCERLLLINISSHDGNKLTIDSLSNIPQHNSINYFHLLVVSATSSAFSAGYSIRDIEEVEGAFEAV